MWDLVISMAFGYSMPGEGQVRSQIYLDSNLINVICILTTPQTLIVLLGYLTILLTGIEVFYSFLSTVLLTRANSIF